MILQRLVSLPISLQLLPLLCYYHHQSIPPPPSSSTWTTTKGGAAVIVVEYLGSSMSRGLLRKFPDNSEFDFDYTQSSIWSPVVPLPSVDSRFDLSCGLSRTLFCSPSKGTTFNTFKRKFNAAVYHKFHQKMKLNKKLDLDFSQLNSASHASNAPKGQGWSKLLKAASKQLKKKKNMKREATNVQPYYNSNNFTDWDF